MSARLQIGPVRCPRIALVLSLVLLLNLGPRLALAGPSAGASIAFGSVTMGAISAPGDVDAFTFSADSGDPILITLTRVSGDLWQRIRLYDPSGALLGDVSNPTHVELARVLPTRHRVDLPLIFGDYTTNGHAQDRLTAGAPFIARVPGTYTILVSDGFADQLTGGYALYLQRLVSPAGATAASFAQTHPGSISQVGEMDAFTFSAGAGDMVLIAMGRVSGEVWQQIRIYDPYGALLNEASSPTHTEVTVEVVTEGEHTILVADGFNGTLLGSYSLYLQRLNAPSAAVPIAFGQTLPGSIVQTAERDTFWFSAEAGDAVFAAMTRAAGSMWQEIRMYDWRGTLLAETSAPVHAEINHVVPETGNFLLLVEDGFNTTLTGSYNLHLQRTNNPAGAVAISPGQTRSGAITIAGEADAFTFSIPAPDTQVVVTMGRTSGTMWPELRLCDPAGSFIAEHSSSTQARLQQILAVEGRYTILAGDGFNGALTGGYTVTLQFLP